MVYCTVYNAFDYDVLMTVYRTRNNRLAQIVDINFHFWFDYELCMFYCLRAKWCTRCVWFWTVSLKSNNNNPINNKHYQCHCYTLCYWQGTVSLMLYRNVNKGKSMHFLNCSVSICLLFRVVHSMPMLMWIWIVVVQQNWKVFTQNFRADLIKHVH